jgi:hypothetical protein
MVNGLLIDEPQLNSLLYPEISRIGIKYNLTMKNIYQIKNLITFQVVEDTSFFDKLL